LQNVTRKTEDHHKRKIEVEWVWSLREKQKGGKEMGGSRHTKELKRNIREEMIVLRNSRYGVRTKQTFLLLLREPKGKCGKVRKRENRERSGPSDPSQSTPGRQEMRKRTRGEKRIWSQKPYFD